MRKTVFKTMAILAASVVALSTWASGTLIEEQSARASSEAGAFVARADDPSAIFYNPAGLAFQTTSLMTGFTAIRETMQWNSPKGPSSRGPRKYFYPMHAYFVYKPDLPVTFGVGAYAPHALATEWSGVWPGAKIAQRTIQRAAYITPSVAFKLGDKWALGINLNYVYSTLYMRQSIMFPAIPYSTPPLTRTPEPGIARLTGSGHGWGGGLGILGKLNKHWQVGFNYRSQVSVDYTGSIDFFRIPTHPDFRPLFPEGGIKTTITLPAAYNLGVAYMNGDWTFEGDVTVVDWTCFDTLSIDFQNPGGKVHDVDSPADWQAAEKYKFGMEYKFSDFLKLGAGVYYDESAVLGKYASPILPDANRWSAQTGLTFSCDKWTVSAFIMGIHFDQKVVPEDTLYVPGTYDASAWLGGISVTYKF